MELNLPRKLGRASIKFAIIGLEMITEINTIVGCLLMRLQSQNNPDNQVVVTI